MINKFKSIKLVSAWTYSSLSVISGFILLPLILNKFSTAEINVWFLFSSIVGLSEMVVFGFNVTFSRFISYTYAGTHYLDFQGIKNNVKNNVLIDNTKQLSELYTLNRLVFLIISIVYIFILFIVGYFGLKKPISYLDNPSSGWIAWYILIGAHFIRILCYTYPVFLQGMNKMDKYYNIHSFQKTIYILAGFIVMYFYPSLINMTLIMGMSIVLSTVMFSLYFNKYREGIKLVRFNKKMFLILWDSVWKSGIPKITAPITLYFSGILFAQVANPALSSSYLFTQRIFNVLQSFSDTTFNTYLPQFARLRSQNIIKEVNKLISKITAISYGIIVIGYLCVILAGAKFLEIINSNTDLASPLILLLFSFAYLLSRLGGFQLNLANQANNIIEHKAVAIYSVFYFGIIFIFIKNLQMWVFPLAMIIAQVITFQYTAKYSYKLYDTSFIKAERYSFIPAMLLLIIINLFYFIG